MRCIQPQDLDVGVPRQGRGRDTRPPRSGRTRRSDIAWVRQWSCLLRPVTGTTRIHDVLVDVPLRLVRRPSYNVIKLEESRPSLPHFLGAGNRRNGTGSHPSPNPCTCRRSARRGHGVGHAGSRGSSSVPEVSSFVAPFSLLISSLGLSSRESIWSRTSVDLRVDLLDVVVHLALEAVQFTGLL